jgi:hypothetical protein
MSTYIQNYGITKTYIKDKNRKIKNEIKWVGDYDGNKANIKLDINDNGNREFVSMQLDKDQLINILGIQPVEISLEKRLTNDFLKDSYKPITLEGALTKRKTRKHRKRISRKYKHKHKYKHTRKI